MIAAALYNQLIGTINLACVWVVFYWAAPEVLLSAWGILFAALMTGLYIACTAYVNTKKIADGLLFVPSGVCLAHFQALIEQCNVSADAVRLRYAYTDDATAMTMFNTLIVDPMLWQGVETDPEAIKAQDVIKKHVLPTLPDDQKALHEQIRCLLSPDVQRFIFKHEIGHVVHRYSIKRILLMGFIAAMATTAALLTAHYVLDYALHGMVAFVLGVAAGFVTDLFMTYGSNVFVKAQQEKNADLFAARFSSVQEIEAAATFFEQYDLCAQAYKANKGCIASIPQSVLSGHPTGISRASYLRALNH